MDYSNQSWFFFDTVLNATPATTQTSEVTQPNYGASSEGLHKYGIIVIAILGSVGNILSFLVFCRPYFSSTTTSIFLRFLALFDTLTLWSYVVWDVAYYFHREVNSVTFCRILFWIQASSPHVASYVLLAVSIERLVAVVHPLHVRIAFTRRRVYTINCCIIAVPLLYNMAYFYLVTVSDSDPAVCRLDGQLKAFADIWYYFDAIVGIIVPGFLILITNVATLMAYRRAKRRRLSMTAQTAQEREKGNHMTIMLMAIALAYWVLMLPSAGFFIAKIYWEFWHTPESFRLYFLLYRIIYLLMLTTNGIQFVIYFLTARKFTSELWELLTCTPPSVSSPKRHKFANTIVFSTKRHKANSNNFV